MMRHSTVHGSTPAKSTLNIGNSIISTESTLGHLFRNYHMLVVVMAALVLSHLLMLKLMPELQQAMASFFIPGTPYSDVKFASSSNQDDKNDDKNRAQWRKVWSEGFNGSSIDTSKWNVIDSGKTHNNELQYYVPDEAWPENGKLMLRSRKRDYNGDDGKRDFTSGKVTTKGKFSFKYGTVEIRAKLPASRGIWPAFWLLPEHGSWPPEIDVFELLGHEPRRIYMNHHWGTYPLQKSKPSSFSGPDFSSSFHRFTLEWQPGWMRWKVDGVTRREVTHNVPDQKMYLILNTAVGGDWPGSPDKSTVFPQHFAIDYIQVFQRFDSSS
jgi:beta-glucanase (GH16 family)